MALFWNDVGGQPTQQDRYMVRQARDLIRAGGLDPASSAAAPVLPAKRRRRCGLQGRPPLALGLRETLFEWFCSIRGAVTTRIPLSSLAAQARLLREEYLLQGLRLRAPVRAPKVTSPWLLRWRRQYGVSLRRPNRRWKVRRPVLLERLRIMWLNLIRLRELCRLAHGYDPDIDGFDQKPFHFNESGSQTRCTLTWRGARTVPLKECAAATRARWSAATYVSSRPSRFPGPPPLEVLFKGGAIVLDRLRAAREDLTSVWGVGRSALADLSWLSVATGVKGSYRTEHVLAYLTHHLPLRTPETPWRILMCDMYGPHDDKAVFDLAWSRGFLLVKHGGGTTGRTLASGHPTAIAQSLLLLHLHPSRPRLRKNHRIGQTPHALSSAASRLLFLFL
ncbi:MAG: hypothetical protein GY772_15435, partial [bacterium]|nr:hypothetical protein [bacterium]